MNERDGSETVDVGELRRLLETLPAPRKKVTKGEIIRALAPAIAKARGEGHTLRAIATLLQSGGVDLSYALLRNTLPPLKRRRKARPPATAKPESIQPPAATRPAPPAPPAAERPDPAANQPVPLSPAAARRLPEKPAAPVFPPGATFIPLPGGHFLPAPDTEDL